MMRSLIGLIIAGLLCVAFPSVSFAQQQVAPCLQSYNSTTGAPNCQDVSSTNPLPVTAGSGGVAPWQPALNGSPQYGLAVTTNTTLTVPAGTKCAEITVETANVRYTEDGSSATTSHGTLVTAGTAFPYCATSLSTMQFTAVSGSPTLDVSYFK